MAYKIVLTRDVTREECPWLDRDFSVGDVVYEFEGATYGCIDWAHGFAACEVPGVNPFFELPYDCGFEKFSPVVQ